MSSVSYFKNAKHFIAKPTFNTYLSYGDALQYLHKHSATGAMHDSEERYPSPLCHPGTGEAVVGRIEAWYGFEIPPEKKIMWVHAPAGYGKTAVAGTVSKKLGSRTDLDFNPVGATFFFWRTSPERNNPARFIITLAYQFAMSIPDLAPHVESAVKRNPMVLNKTLEAQLMKLIVEPFKALGELDSMPHRLVIVDGLDECINSDQESRVEKHYAEDQEHVQTRVLNLIRILQSYDLPLCFLILSRPEPWINQHIEAYEFQTVTEILDLYEVGDHMKDVEKFVRDELARIAGSLASNPGDDEQWPGKELVQKLLWRTGGHMLYAATVIRHIDVPYDDPPQRLKNLLDDRLHSNPDLAHSSSFSCLFELYRQIIRSCPPANRALMGEVLEEIMVFHDRLVPYDNCILNVLDRISGRVAGRGITALRPLHAVMRLATHEGPCPRSFRIRFFYHSSFPEFLKNYPQTGLDVTVDVQKGIGRLLAGSLETLSPVTLTTQVDEVTRFALSHWTSLWRRWKPSTEAEYSCQLKAMLTIDLTACFVKEITGEALVPQTSAIVDSTSDLYDPKNKLFGDISSPIFSPFFEDAVSHLRLSVERAFLHVLHPNVFASHYEDCLRRDDVETVLVLTMCLHGYAIQTSKHHPTGTGFASIVQALRTLRLEQEELYELLDRDASRHQLCENLYELGRQNGELRSTDSPPTSSA
ncbi:hypothetical protein EST38_g3144 [Candolleomyces aberdarensis]|uniref:Nephrocystin 3-like N-terminal domain-containing protein n=1 Tax=Candolleomyces aberdarensis TaxID=2316362 RepID=A0A4Q2DRA4_9AGAR|nr:hypothetical protein EST38_g3144 [Candolleomyces aberdarensis]